MKIKVGDPVPIILQIVKGESGLYPQAEIRDDAANLLTTLNMTHEASGLYVTSTYNMPDEEFIKVTYIVYTDAGHTTESLSYLRGIDVVVKDASVVPDVAGTAAGLHTTTDALVTTVDGVVDAILIDTGTTIPTDIAALNDISVADIIAGVTDGPLDLQEMMRIILAATAGKSSGGGTVTLVFRDAADAKARITATVDASGNRTAMVLDGT